MFDKLVEVLLQFIDLFRCWVVVREGTRAVIYTLGRPTRTVGPRDGWAGTGFHFKAPLGVEAEDDTSIRDELWTTMGQDVMTADGACVHIRGGFRLQILPEKVEMFQVLLGDESEALKTGLAGAIAEAVGRHSLEQLKDPDELSAFRQTVLELARRRLARYGYRIYDFWWTERTSVRTYRLITGE